MNPTIQRMSDIVWSKFLRMPYGHILDYVADGAEIRYPSGEECKNADFYRQGLYMNGITSLMMVNDMKNFTHSDDFSTDWTPLLRLHRDCSTSIAQNISLALEQLSYWTNEIVPARVQEHKILGNSVYGTLIAVTSKNAEIAAAAYKRYSENAKAVQWEKLHLPLAYVAEAIEIMATLQ